MCWQRSQKRPPGRRFIRSHRSSQGSWIRISIVTGVGLAPGRQSWDGADRDYSSSAPAGSGSAADGATGSGSEADGAAGSGSTAAAGAGDAASATANGGGVAR